MNKFGLVVLAAGCLSAQDPIGYQGPGVGSRGAGQIGRRAGQEVGLRYYVNVSGVYETGLLPVSVDSNGNLLEVNDLYGVEAAVGVYGTRSWRRSALGLSYRGDYRHYTTNQYFNGSDHALVLGFTHQPTRRVILDFRQVAGTVSRAVGGYYGYTPVTSLDVPNTLLFDNRTNYLESSMTATWQKSVRTAFTAGGDGYTVRRQSSALVDMNGYRLNGGMSHRLSRTRTVQGNYSFLHFDFPGAFGESDVHMFSGGFGFLLGRRWELKLVGGAYRAEVQGLQRLALDAAISELLGVGSVIEAFYRKNTLPTYEASLTGTYQHSRLSFHYSNSVTPGNGVFLTTRSQDGGVSFGYTGIRRWSIQLGGGYMRMNSVGPDIRPYASYVAGGGVSYALTSSLHLTARIDARRNEVDSTFFRRTGTRATVGLAFSPGDIPLSIW